MTLTWIVMRKQLDLRKPNTVFCHVDCFCLKGKKEEYINKLNDLIVNLTPENITQHSRIE